jgi:UDP-GlcNAc:undecaprenyl-phosphate GlcNAc-1-phosphate transferase
VLGLELYRAGGPGKAPAFFPLLTASLAILDAGLAVLRRLLLGRSPLFGDRSHFYDLLRERGWSARRVALTCYGLTGAISATGLAILQLGFMLQLTICLTILAGLLATAVRLGSLRGDLTIRGEIGESESSEREPLWSEPPAERVRQKA